MARQALSSRSKLFEIEGLAELKANVAKVLDRTSAQEIKEVYMDGARHFLAEFRADAPVLTGRFRDSGFISPGDPKKPDALFIINYKKAPHAWIVEFGSSKTRAHHTVRDTITTTRALIARIISEGWRSALEDAVK